MAQPRAKLSKEVAVAIATLTLLRQFLPHLPLLASLLSSFIREHARIPTATATIKLAAWFIFEAVDR